MKSGPRQAALAECGGLSPASLPPHRGPVYPLGPPELPLERSAVPSHATAFSPSPSPGPRRRSCVRREARGPCPTSRRANFRGPERVPDGPGRWLRIAPIMPRETSSSVKYTYVELKFAFSLAWLIGVSLGERTARDNREGG